MASKYTIRVTADMIQHDKSVRKSASEVYKYNMQVKNAKKEMGNLNRNLGTASTSLRNFTNSIGTGKIGSLTSSLQGLSSAFGGLGGNIGNLRTSLSALGGNITALINPWAAATAAVIGAGTAFYKYNVELQKTTRRTEQLLNISRESAVHIRNGIQAIADTYKVDFNETLNSTMTLMNQFGLSADDALDIVEKGFLVMGDDAEKLVPLIQQFAPKFRDAGVSAEEFIAILANTRSGIFGEDGLAAIATAEKNIKNMSKSTKQSLKAIGIDADDLATKLANGDISVYGALLQISEKLRDLPPQSQEVGSALQDVFGKQGVKAGQELITKLGLVETNLNNIIDKTSDYEKTLDDLRKAHKGVNEEMAILFGTDWQIETLGTKIETFLLKNVEYLLKDLREAKKFFNELFGGYTPTASVGGGAGSSGGSSGGGNRGEGSSSDSPQPPKLDKPTGKTPKTKSNEKKKYTNEEYLRKETIFNDKIRKQLELNLENQKQITAEKEKQQRLDAVKKAAQGSPQLQKQIDFFNQLQEANKRRETEKAAKDQEKLNNTLQLTAQLAADAGSALGSLGQAFDSKALNASAILAQAVATMILSYAEAGEMAAKIGPWAWLAFSLEGIAQVGMIVSQMKQLGKNDKFAEGGIVGGSRFIGDMNLARVNSGEMILNGKQQRNLFNILNSSNGVGGSSEYASVKFRISGNDLVGVLNNYNNKRGKAQ